MNKPCESLITFFTGLCHILVMLKRPNYESIHVMLLITVILLMLPVSKSLLLNCANSKNDLALYRSIIFTNGTQESRIAALSKEREQAKSRSSVVTTEIQELGVFYPAEAEHQVFDSTSVLF